MDLKNGLEEFDKKWVAFEEVEKSLNKLFCISSFHINF